MGNHREFFESDEILGKVYDRKIIARLLKYIRPYYKYVVLDVILLISSSLLELLWPQLVRIGIDKYILNIEMGISEKIKYIIIISFIYFLTLLIFSIIRYLSIFITSFTAQNVINNIRVELFSHIEQLAMNFFVKNPVGRLVTRVTNDVEQINEFFSSGVIGLFGDFIMLTGIVIAMLVVSWKLSLVSFSVMPLLIIATYYFRKSIIPAFRNIRKNIAKINAFVQESISGIKVIQAFNTEEKQKIKFNSLSDEYYLSRLKTLKIHSIFRPAVEDISALAISLILWFGGLSVVKNYVTPGVLILFLIYSRRFFRPLIDLSEKYNIIQNTMVSAERIFKILDTHEKILESPPVVAPKNIEGKIEFKNIWFCYNPNEWVLKNVSFVVKPGEKIAIVGQTGAGKTTIVNLLLRFYQPQKGEILIDGINIKNLSLETLHKNIIYIPQDFFIFKGNILTNIKLWNNDISPKKAIFSARKTYVSKFIEKMPDKYYESVLEGGNNLSSGQKQLISFARALAFSPKVLILDEATSNVDTETEFLIQKAIQNLMKNHTSIIIAHRLSTIKTVNRILVMHKGKIVEEGTHNQLLRKKGIYYKLYKIQFEK